MTEPRSPARRWWQVRLRTALLIVVVAALGLNLARDLGQLPALGRRAARDQEFNRRELDMDGSDRVATVELVSPWAVEDRWDVYLPPGGRYRLCLATRVGEFGDRPSSFKSAPIKPGRHILSIDEQSVGIGWRVAATWNRAEVLAIDETNNWFGHAGHMVEMSGKSHFPLGGRIPIIAKKFLGGRPGQVLLPPPGPVVEVPGIQMWIEAEPEGPPAAGSVSGPVVTSPAEKSPPAR